MALFRLQPPLQNKRIVMYISIILYLMFGILCSYHWFKEDYGEEYEKLKEKKETEEGMAVLIMLVMAVFWPLFFLYKIYKAL